MITERPRKLSAEPAPLTRTLSTPTSAPRWVLTYPRKELDMTITPTTLFRAAGVAASTAGLIFIGVQINHPHLDATSITTTDVIAATP